MKALVLAHPASTSIKTKLTNARIVTVSSFLPGRLVRPASRAPHLSSVPVERLGNVDQHRASSALRVTEPGNNPAAQPLALGDIRGLPWRRTLIGFFRVRQRGACCCWVCQRRASAQEQEREAAY